MLKLSVSNIAWSEPQEDVLRILASCGVKGIEVAPTKLAPWESLCEDHFLSYQALCADFGISISSFQAILFNKPDLQLLGSEDSFSHLLAHITQVSRYAQIAGAGCMVFGAPQNRLLQNLCQESAYDLACWRFMALAKAAWEHGVRIAIEPVPEVYGCQFLNRYGDVLRLVSEVNHPGLAAHLDTACVWLGGDSIDRAIADSCGVFRHFHISEPDLASFDNPDSRHAMAARALHLCGYNDWICIEMKQQAEVTTALREAIKFVHSTYYEE